jgi:hypothetical protein|tara:strand:- start:163 stop:396 length:234 start_codon:yes stop_codon:yes gene_type:complete
MDLAIRASRIEHILQDDVFQDLIKQLKQDQVDIFLTPGKALDQIDEARRQVRAIEDLIIRMRRVLFDAQINDSKSKK